MDVIVYGLCAATTAACVILLSRGYKRTGARLLLWSAVFFVLIKAENMIFLEEQFNSPKI